MVSTRAVKLKFYEGERVLCYEPDPTKAKVLYDSKVLDIITNKDHRGRKSVEYLIHFQGWNSSWDRCVGEEYVLKDTPENRQLQKDLAEQSQLQLGAYLYRRERKKFSRKPADRATSEDGNCSSPPRVFTDDGQEHDATSSSDEDSSLEEDVIPIELTQGIRDILEHDYFLINTKQKLVKLPAEPNVITILETYWRQYATSQLCGLRNNGRYKLSLNNSTHKARPEDIQRNLALCKEVVDGLRIYFDYTINDLLLYKSEQNQITTAPAWDTLKCELKQENDSDFSHHPNSNSVDEDYNHNDHDHGDRKRSTKRRNLRSSNTNESHMNGTSTMENVFVNLKQCSITDTPHNPGTSKNKIMSWRLLPDHVYYQQPPSPCLVYGAIHLARLFVKLPELLGASTVPDHKLNVLMRHLDSFVFFLDEHKEWFGDKYYTE